MSLKKILMVVLMTMFSIGANAGNSVSVEVEVDLVNRTAKGNMVTARFSKFEYARIGCGVRVALIDSSESISYGFCQAAGENNTDNLGDYAVCYTQDAKLMAEISTISDYSFITFDWDENNDCTRIGHSSQSQYIPNYKMKKKK